MIETKHTPGPWVAENSSVIGPDNKIICGCIRGSIDRKSHEEDYATARLIAAAPKMLAALECEEALIARPLGYDTLKRHGLTAAESPYNFCNRLRTEAIAAATGSTP